MKAFVKERFRSMLSALTAKWLSLRLGLSAASSTY